MNQTAVVSAIGLLAVCVLGASGADKSDPLAPIKDTPGLPRVLLIGDSISIGFTLPLRELLKGKANVHRPETNCSSTKDGLAQIDDWLGKKKWDVIHFNFGLHDLKYVDETGRAVNVERGHIQASVEEYERNLRALIQRLKSTGARLIFATTTPVPDGTGNRIAGSEDAYNAVAIKVIGDTMVVLDDLHEVAKAKPDLQLPRNVHFTAAGYRELARHAAAEIEKALTQRRD